MADVVSIDIVAVIFDFDDTLAPDTTTKLLQTHGVDPSKFWATVRSLVESGYDPSSAYLKLLLDHIGEGKPLGPLSNAGLRTFGASLDGDFFPGLPHFFDEVHETVAKNYNNIKVEFYIISGGLYEILIGSSVVQKYFKAVYGCHLAGDSAGGVLKYVKRSVSFTEKTRYIFEIHKGLNPDQTLKNPALVNKHIKQADRRVPLKNMIYVGDGLTDIPCFSLLLSNGGMGFGVFDPKKEEKAKEALEQFLKTDRVLSMHAPDFEPEAELGLLLRTAIKTVCSGLMVKRKQAEP